MAEKENSELIFGFTSSTSLGVQLKNELEDLRNGFDIKTKSERNYNYYCFNLKEQRSSEN